MMKTKSLWIAMSCVAVLGLMTGCPNDPSSTCGDGVIEGGEDCDLTELGGATCADVVPGTAGTLVCSTQCTFITTGCTIVGSCGNGIPEFGETCDCGTDPGNLPADCTDVNGGANANCDIDCGRIDLCGDGVVSGAEECDCGAPSMISAPAAGCTVYNGGVDATCDDSCNDVVACEHDPGEACNPLAGDPPTHGCCPDEWGNQMDCKSSPFSGGDPNFCAMTCTDAADCYWSNTCLTNIGSDMCYAAICGPGSNFVDSPLNDACQAVGGEVGYCAPFGRYSDTHDWYGFCLENGDIAHGDTCPDVALLDTDRYADGGAATQMCNAGICIGQPNMDGVCASFCDWEAEYDEVILNSGTAFCPAGSNCWAEATISEDMYSQYADYGWRGSNLAYCRQTAAADPTNGLTTCSLVTGQLLTDTALSCADTHTDGICTPILYGTSYATNTCPNGQSDCTAPANCDTDPTSFYFGYCVVEGTEFTFGSLIGRCLDGPATQTNVWDTCDPAADLCPTGTWCVAENVFDDASGQARCVPYCDTNVHDGSAGNSCQDLGAPDGDGTADSTPVCTSVSYSYLAWTNGTLSGGGGADDTEKTRLGFCAYPRP